MTLAFRKHLLPFTPRKERRGGSGRQKKNVKVFEEVFNCSKSTCVHLFSESKMGAVARAKETMKVEGKGKEEGRGQRKR